MKRSSWIFQVSLKFNVLITNTQRRRQTWKRRQEDGDRDWSDMAPHQGMTATRNWKRQGTLLWTESLCPTFPPPHSYVEALTFSVNGVWRQVLWEVKLRWGHEAGALKVGPYEEIHQSPFSLTLGGKAMWASREKAAMYSQEVGSHQEPNLPAHWPWTLKLLPSLWYFVRAAGVKTNTFFSTASGASITLPKLWFRNSGLQNC